ncbi:MAG TPA: DUF4396 domain-containing protein [Acidimicrobiales bacterium]|nr:DUF4396 domain-containing protein [Acidimicrobiales bacterium]
MAPRWLTVLAWSYLAICFGCAGVIAYDIVFNHRRQQMGVMNFVFPITALYFGPLALTLYWHWGRAPDRVPVPSMSMSTARLSQPVPIALHHPTVHERPGHGVANAAVPNDPHRPSAPGEQGRPRWVTMAIEVSHCGSGCTIGDVIAEFAVFWLALSIAGSTMAAEYVSDYALALVFGIMFQYFAIAPMRGLGLKDGLVQAGKADFISLTAFEVGLFGWMAVMAYVLFPAPHRLTPASASFWLLMQVGMMIGYFSSWPANVWLVKRGIKVPM